MGTVAEGAGAGETDTVTVGLFEKMLPPNAKNSDPSASTPSTRAAMILFLSFGDFPANGFIT